MNEAEIQLVAELVAKPGKAEALRAAMAEIIPDVRQEPGCLRYDMHVDRDNESRIIMLEAWSDAAALEAHANGAALKILGQRLDGVLERPAVLTKLRHLL